MWYDGRVLKDSFSQKEISLDTSSLDIWNIYSIVCHAVKGIYHRQKFNVIVN